MAIAVFTFATTAAQSGRPAVRNNCIEALRRMGWQHPSRTTACLIARSPLTAIVCAGVLKGGALSNFGGDGKAFGLLPFGVPPSTQSVMSESCSCVSPLSFGNLQSPTAPQGASVVTAQRS